MSKALRLALLGLAVTFGSVVAWRVIVTYQADRFADVEPERAISLEAGHPAALVAIGRRQLAEGDAGAAADTARRLLRAEPLAASAFALLAASSESDPGASNALELHAIAIRRAPRDLRTRAWFIDRYIRLRDFDHALLHVGVVLRIAPEQATALIPLLAEAANDPDFADALVRTVAAKPPWRTAVLSYMAANGREAAMSRVYGDLQDAGDLSLAEAAPWFDRLSRDGYPGEAYSRWAGSVGLAPGEPLLPVYNGDFNRELTSIGFDWRSGPVAGVVVERRQSGENDNRVLEVSFSGRRAPDIKLEEWLFLGPGSYLLRLRAKALALHSESGLRWAIECRDPVVREVASSTALKGSFPWTWLEVAFDIPRDQCVSQELRLVNSGPDGAGKETLGDIWFDDFSIERRSASSPMGSARPQVPLRIPSTVRPNPPSVRDTRVSFE